LTVILGVDLFRVGVDWLDFEIAIATGKLFKENGVLGHDVSMYTWYSFLDNPAPFGNGDSMFFHYSSIHPTDSIFGHDLITSSSSEMDGYLFFFQLSRRGVFLGLHVYFFLYSPPFITYIPCHIRSLELASGEFIRELETFVFGHGIVYKIKVFVDI